MTNNVVIIQARLGATRLPGKVLKQLGPRKVIEWSISAASKIPGVRKVVIATTDQALDDPVYEWCTNHDVTCHRGPEHDVLRRYALAAKAEDADNIIRITADCPFIDPHVCGQVLALHQRTGADFTTNNDPPTWPDGLDCEIMTRQSLEAADHEATRPSDREHVATYIRNTRSRFKLEALVCPLPDMNTERWTLDTPEDYEFLCAVVNNLPTEAPSFLDILSVLDENPELRTINMNQQRDEGLAASISRETPDLNRNYDVSSKMLEKAETVIPLGAQTFSKCWQQYPRGNSPLFLTHGDKARVWDVDGNEYVDLVSGLLCVLIGYRDPDVDYAVRRQLSQGISFSLATELEATVANELIEIIPCAESVRFGKNGTDATSGAVRIARAATGRDRIAVGGYHGWQDWYIGATTRNKGVPEAVCDLTHSFPYNNITALDALLKSHKGEFAAVILEPAGAGLPEDGYLEAVQELTHRHGAILIFDEIITGFRWAIGGAQEYYGVTPDLASFGKAMGNGLPISAVVGRADLMQQMEEVFFSSTFGGETLSLAASLAVIKKVKNEPVIEKLWNTGGQISEYVNAAIIANGLSNVMSLNGTNPWTVIGFRDNPSGSKEAIKTIFIREMLKAGVLVNASINVSYAVSDNDLMRIYSAFDHALPIVAESLKDGNLDTLIGNQGIQPVFSIRSA